MKNDLSPSNFTLKEIPLDMSFFNKSWSSIKNCFWEGKGGMDFPGGTCGGVGKEIFLIHVITHVKL